MAGMVGVAARPAAAAEAAAHDVLELRQYKIVHGHRDEMIALFERHFIESQDALGMRIVGTFRDLDDPNRFTWLRTFPDMAAREKQLTAFYFGPVWQARRGEANPLLDDNDNVLLLKPAEPRLALAPLSGTRRAESSSLVVATIHYLWKDPAEGFTRFFNEDMTPELVTAGLPVLGAYVAENAPNTFPRLPVRQHEKVFVWFTRAMSAADHAAAHRRLLARAAWRNRVAPALADYEERGAQVLRLAPTLRSALR